MASQTSFKINIRRIKEFAMAKLPKGSALRDVLLSESDDMDVNDFLAKMEIWLKLLRREPL